MDKTYKKVVVFVTNACGQNINPANIYGMDNLYGTEYTLYETARVLSDIYTVYITLPRSAGFYMRTNGINWISEFDFNEMNRYVHVDHLVILRFMEPFYKLRLDNVDNIYYWLFDIIPLLQGYPRDSINLTNRIVKRYISMGNPPISQFYLPYGFADKWTAIRGAIKPVENWSIQSLLASPRKPLSFIYSSSIGKGLINLLTIWPLIVKRFPGATLQICYGYTPDEYRAISSYFPGDKSVDYVGKVEQKALWEKYKNTDYWFFPNADAETCCNTTFETAHFGPIQITNNKCALDENVSGCKIPITEVDRKFVDIVLDGIEYLEMHPHEKVRIRKRQYAFSLENTWMHRKQDWINLFS